MTRCRLRPKTSSASTCHIRAWSARKRGHVPGVDVDQVARRLGGALGGEEEDRFGDVLGVHAAAEQAAGAVVGFELLLLDAVGARAFGAPLARPDAGALQDGVGIDDV